ncbi:MAG: MoxR family ATPase [Gammaproteobacteria bacterium]|nr:MoxR family ATPase [Gammaproteobacteria bacterium]
MRPQNISTILEQEYLSVAEGHHTPVMLWGPPGVGKSQLVLQVGERHQVEVIDIRLSQMEPSDLRGIPFRQGSAVEWAIPALLPDLQRHGEQGILFLDEITSAPPSVSAAAYQLILDRRLGDYRVPAGWAIVAAGNRQGDRGVTYTMPAPLANRFSHFEVDVHVDDWVAWAYQHGIDAGLIAFLRFRPELLFSFDPSHNPVAFPSPRSWEFAHRALQKYRQHQALLLQTLQACVGAVAAIELKAFIDNLDNLPDIDAILRGEEVAIPTAIDLQYAVAAALVGRAIAAKGRADAEQIDNAILNFATLLPQQEMGVMLVFDLHRAIGQQLFALPGFAPWAGTVADMMLHG